MTAPKGLFDDPNVFGPFMIVPFAFILAELVEPTLLAWGRRWLLDHSAGVRCGRPLLVLASCVAEHVALVVITMIAAYALRRGGLLQATKTLGLGLIAVGVIVAALFLTGSTSFFLARAHVQYYDTARFQGQDASFELARTHLFGIGPGQYLDVVGIAAHSTYLRALGEEGVLGLALIILLLFTTLILACGNVVRGRSTFGISSVPLLGLWVGLIANSFFIDTLHWRHVWLVAGSSGPGPAYQSSRGARSLRSHDNQGQAMSKRRLRSRGTPRLVAPQGISAGRPPESRIDDYGALHALEPNLTPVVIDSPRAELHVVARAHHVLEHDAFVREVRHCPCTFVNDLGHTRADSRRPTAVLAHHAIEQEDHDSCCSDRASFRSLPST